MTSPRVALCLSIFLILGTLAACKSVTRGAIRNDGLMPITVSLATPDGSEVVRFETVAPNTTSAFVKLPFKKRLEQVVVKVIEGAGRSGNVDLRSTYDNVVIISPDRDPALDAQENPDNKFW